MSPEEINLVTESIKAIGSKGSNEWIPVIAALGGAVLGSFSSTITSSIIERKKEKMFSLQITRSLITEISALLNLMETRGFLDSINNAIAHLKENPDDTYILASDIPPHYSRVYQENCKHLGVVDHETSKQIINFHHLVDAIVQDVKMDGTFSKSPTIEAYVEANKILTLAIRIGRNLETKKINC